MKRRFEEPIRNPPPVPPGKRLPTPEERGVLRDLEIQRNFARRKQADAEAAGRKAEARTWQRKSSDLTGQMIDYSRERSIHHVPTFSVKDVIAGRDTGQRDIDRLTHFRGIDGTVVSRTRAAEVLDEAAQAMAELRSDLESLPDMEAVSREEWRQLLRQNGAPASAFGGELSRVACDTAGPIEGAPPEAPPTTDDGDAAEPVAAGQGRKPRSPRRKIEHAEAASGGETESDLQWVFDADGTSRQVPRAKRRR